MATSRLADLNRIYPVIPRVLCGQDLIFRPTEALSNAEGGAEGSVCQITRCASAANILRQRKGPTPPRPTPSLPKKSGCREVPQQKSGAVYAQCAASPTAPQSRSRFAEFASWFPSNATQSPTGCLPTPMNSSQGWFARVGRTLLSAAFDLDRVGRTLLSAAFDLDLGSGSPNVFLELMGGHPSTLQQTLPLFRLPELFLLAVIPSSARDLGSFRGSAWCRVAGGCQEGSASLRL